MEWFTKTIIPGVKDGLQALGRTDEPPLLLRAHDTDCKLVMDAALPLYKNLYTMHKYNGESLTTYEPRGPWSKIHTDLSSLGSIHISNVHILANLEPFRWGSPDFVQKAVQAMHNVPMHCTFIRSLRTGIGRIQPTNCQMANGNSNWTATGFGIRPGDVMHGTATGIVLTRSVTGIINWDSSTEHPTRMQAIFALLMKKAEKLPRSYYVVLVSRKETVRRYCWGCL